MNLESEINAAVDAATAQPPSPPDTPVPTSPAVAPSPTSIDGKPLIPPPAPRSGSDRRSTRDVQSGERATAQPTPPGAASTTAQPPYAVPPQAEWEGILENARTKAAEAARREVQEQFAGLQPDVWNSHYRSYIEGLTTNPVAFHRWLGEQLAQRGLNVSEPPPAPEPLTMPQPSLYADAGNGRSIPAYSADDVQQAIGVAIKMAQSQWDQRLGPLEAIAHEANVSSLMVKADQHAAEIINEAKTLPYFDELAPDIAEIMTRDKRYSVEGAYARALKEKMPAITARSRQAVLSEIEKAPAARTAIDPSRPVIAGSRRTKGLSLDERFEQALTEAMGPR